MATDESKILPGFRWFHGACVRTVTGLMMPAMFTSAAYAQDSTTYLTEFKADIPVAVYKSVDAAGRITYSTDWPDDTVSIEEIPIAPGPSDQRIEANRQRGGQLRQAALGLSKAREQRLAEREEKEKKRLERLALQRSARPPVCERPVYVGWHPRWWVYPHAGWHRAWPHGHAAAGHRGSRDLQRGSPLHPNIFLR